jgi:hypothetical protein
MLRRLIIWSIILVLGTVLSGCAFLAAPPVVPENVRLKNPTNLPKPVVTNFTEALACMDDLMLINNVTPIYIASPQITNYTSDRSISMGSTEMLISALSRMSIRSSGVRYVSFGPEVQNVLTLQGAHPNNKSFRAPDFFIRGGLTEFNKSLWAGQSGAGLSYEIEGGQLQAAGLTALLRGTKDFTKSISRNASLGTLTMDLNVGFISNLQMIPGVTSSNTLALENNAGTSITGDLSLATLGLSYSLSENISEDFNQVLRSLIQVGAIEIVGKLQGLPYWRCLSNAGVVEEQDKKLRAQFLDRVSEDPGALVHIAQKALSDLKYYAGPIHGKLDFSTQDALQRYQQQMGLLASGNLTYETFRMLNIYTPARITSYVPWWQNYNTVERGVTTVKVDPPKPAEAPVPAQTPADKQKKATKVNTDHGKAKVAETASNVELPGSGSPMAWRKMGPLTQKKLEASQVWLAQTPSDHWFVQLISSDSSQPQLIEKFVEDADRLLGADRVRAYLINLDGRDRVGVVFGDFASEPEAASAASNVPAELSAYRPYARQMRRLR